LCPPHSDIPRSRFSTANVPSGLHKK
jgi:hypothetical protein